MLFKTTIYTVPTRTLPLKFNDLRQGTLNRASAPISIIRSPHIDKKSWEQFKFFTQKKTQVIKNPKKLKAFLQLAKTLHKMYAPLRIKINISYYQSFTTKF
jgi:ribosomal protein S10